MTSATIKNEIAKRDFCDRYETSLAELGFQCAKKIAKKFFVKLIIDDGSKIKKYGTGNEIYLRISNTQFIKHGWIVD